MVAASFSFLILTITGLPINIEELDGAIYVTSRGEDGRRILQGEIFNQAANRLSEELKYLCSISWSNDNEWSREYNAYFHHGAWDISDDTDAHEIQDERGGALDKFLDGFKPQETITERSDAQK